MALYCLLEVAMAGSQERRRFPFRASQQAHVLQFSRQSQCRAPNCKHRQRSCEVQLILIALR